MDYLCGSKHPKAPRTALPLWWKGNQSAAAQVGRMVIIPPRVEGKEEEREGEVSEGKRDVEEREEGGGGAGLPTGHL